MAERKDDEIAGEVAISEMGVATNFILRYTYPTHTGSGNRVPDFVFLINLVDVATRIPLF